MLRGISLGAMCALLAGCNPELAGPIPGALDEGPLLEALRKATGPVPAARALGVPDAKYICYAAEENASPQVLAAIIRREFGADISNSKINKRLDDRLIYLVTPAGETAVKLEKGKATIGASAQTCFEGSHAVFAPIDGRWVLRDGPDRIGSPEGWMLLKTLAAAQAPLSAAPALGAAGARYICLSDHKTPEQMVAEIEFRFKERLPLSRIQRPLKPFEYGIYIVGPGPESYITVAGGEGLSPAGDLCVRGDEAVFSKAHDQWVLTARSRT